MQRVFVLDKNKNPLMPCEPARARELLRKGRAAVYRRFPFTIIIKDRDGGQTQPVQVKIDPGSKITGLASYEVREYLLEKWGRECAYCGITNVPLEVEHIIPKDRVSNLTIACKACNKRKGTQTAAEFGYPHIQVQAKIPLKDAAASPTA